MSAARRLRIAVIAPLRYPISEPHAGGLESSVWNQVRSLRRRGHEVVLCAVEGSDFLEGGPEAFVMPAVVWDDPAAASDITYPPGYLTRGFGALAGALAYIADALEPFDIVDNHCLHGLPLAWAPRLGAPLLTTLHTPPLPDLLSAHAASPEPRGAFLAVSEHTAAEWAVEGIEATVLANAVDTDRWEFGAGGADLVWFGRIVPEKGTHLALQAARLAGRRIVLAGRIGDASYFARQVAPQLDKDARYVGELTQPQLSALVGASACALVTPVWDEPFGLVIAEAMATGTPVVSFAAGGAPEVVGTGPGTALVPQGDLTAMAREIGRLVTAAEADPAVRRALRADAVARFSLRRRAAELERLYVGLLDAERFRRQRRALADARDGHPDGNADLFRALESDLA